MIWERFNWGYKRVPNDETPEGGGDADTSAENEETTEETEETDDSEDEESGEENADDLSEDEIKNSKELFKLLKDPKTANMVIETMARKAGIMKDPPQTKAEEKKAVREVKEVLKEKLGPEYYALFGDKLSGALEEIVSSIREEANASTQQIAAQQAEQEVDRAFEKLSRDTKGESNKFKAQMTELSKKILPADGVSTFDYLQMLYSIASGKKNTASASKQIADRINRNRSDVADRTRTAVGSPNNKGGQQQNQPKGLKAIVEAATRQHWKDR